jgi:hypothetical protein
MRVADGRKLFAGFEAILKENGPPGRFILSSARGQPKNYLMHRKFFV